MASKPKPKQKRVHHAEHPEIHYKDTGATEYKEEKQKLTDMQKDTYKQRKIAKLMNKLNIGFPKKRKNVRKTVITMLSQGTKFKPSDLEKKTDEELVKIILEENDRIFVEVNAINGDIEELVRQIRTLQREYNSPFGDKINPLNLKKRKLEQERDALNAQLPKYGDLMNDLEEQYETLAKEIHDYPENMFTPPSPSPSPPSPTTMENTTFNRSRRIASKRERANLLNERIGGKRQTRRRRRQ